MAIDFDRNTITSGYSIDKINDNFDKLEIALQDGFSRTGNSPNQLETDLDMNGHNIINIGSLSTNGQTLQEYVDEAEAAVLLAQKWAENPEDSPVTPGHFSSLHWAEKAFDNHTAGVAGVSSFNGRTLAVVPATNDYTSAQVQHGGGSVADALALKADASAVAAKADTATVNVALSTKLDKAGDTMSGDLNMGGNDIVGVASINGGPVGGASTNYAENGNFEVSFNTKSANSGGVFVKFAVDRWVQRYLGSTSVHSQQSFPLGSTLVPNAYKYLRTVVTSVAGVSNFSELDFPMEGLDRLAGKQVTVTFWGRADTTRNISFFTTQYFGAGGSANVHENQTVIGLTSSWQKYSLVINISPLAGKTVGSDNRQCTLFRWMYDIGSTAASAYGIPALQQSGTFEIAHVSINDGDASSVADPFNIRHVQQEIDIAQRYYETGKVVGAGYAASGQTIFLYVPYKVQKVPVTSPAGSVTGSLTNLTFSSIVLGPGYMYVVLTANATGAWSANYDWIADYEL